MPYCQARHCDKWLYFPGEKPKRFYRPYRCGGKAVKDERLCETCKNVEPGKTQMSRGFNHGLCGDLIPPNSHAYGGPWYLAQVAKYGEPHKETLAVAVEYLEEEFDVTAGPEVAQLFRDGIAIITKKMPTISSNSNSSSKPKKAARTANVTADRKSTPTNKQAYLKESIASATIKLKENAAYLTPEAIESVNEPLQVCEVEYMTVKKTQINGVAYYLNTNTNAIYEIAEFRNGLGARIGRYNEESEEIVDCADNADADADADTD